MKEEAEETLLENNYSPGFCLQVADMVNLMQAVVSGLPISDGDLINSQKEGRLDNATRAQFVIKSLSEKLGIPVKFVAGVPVEVTASQK